jgi:hypothetical protein
MTQLSCAGRVVAEYVVHPELALALSPRPYLHPVRTLAGLTVTDAVPRDHPWHLGLSVGLQHVTGADGRTVNFWGGRTYLRDQGYRWLDDHGRVEHVGWTGFGGAASEQELAWQVPDLSAQWTTMLSERRRLSANAFHLPGNSAEDAQDSAPAWALQVRFELENVTSAPVTLGSPGTHGRAGGGYGGFFWRAATSQSAIEVRTRDAEGEDDVHGHPAEWLIFGGSDPGTGRSWSLLLAGQDAVTRADPWFVRTRDYPGVGSALAYEKPVVLEPGESLARALLVAVVDGRLEGAQAPEVLKAARGH